MSLTQADQPSCSDHLIVSGTDYASENIVHRGTSMERAEETKTKCKYCPIRLSKLREMEKRRPAKSGTNLATSATSEMLMPRYVDKSCQTSAALFEQAVMTRKEIRMFMVVLRYRNGKPLRTETFCNCVLHGKEDSCTCGEDDKHFEWLWDRYNRGDSAHVLEQSHVVMFHKNYSCGTTAIRGEQAMDRDQYFWEVKMTTPVYGTDMMVGVGTAGVDLNRFHNEFCSMLGKDSDSWGLSYDGRVQHSGRKMDFCGRFGQGAIIGVHLDMWHGTLAFFKNRQCLGVAFRGLRGRTLYPMVCSTAARSTMKIVSSRSFPSSLQYLCCRKLRRLVPPHLSVLDAVAMPPGLKAFLSNNLWWLLQVMRQPRTKPKHAVATASSSSAVWSSSFSSPSSSSDYICNICLPLKNVFEGYSDDDGESSDDDNIHNGFNYLDSEDEEDSTGEDRDDEFGTLWSPPSSWFFQRRRGLTHNPVVPHAGSVWQTSSDGADSSSTASPSKRCRLDSSVSTSFEEEEHESEDSIPGKAEDELSFEIEESRDRDTKRQQPNPRKRKRALSFT
ncbi:spry domain-containing socs box protein 3 [Plakobranchus ocellatus]|uniref:SPRY domain-containing SOCS box protein 3 n=1 Tax=Plakobranchus ocellatus TaxID=259542 RepID=A0AAV3YXD1_9GAST|nr:spry domain-containing socs box protein 3 [Plakobranchus ocellatus]